MEKNDKTLLANSNGFHRKVREKQDQAPSVAIKDLIFFPMSTPRNATKEPCNATGSA